MWAVSICCSLPIRSTDARTPTRVGASADHIVGFEAVVLVEGLPVTARPAVEGARRKTGSDRQNRSPVQWRQGSC